MKHISLTFNRLGAVTPIIKGLDMHNLHANFVKILEACKHFAQELVFDI